MTSIKLYSDEHIRKQIVYALKSKGINIISTDDVGNKGKSDIEQLKFAILDGRALLTKDADYLSITKMPVHHGILFITKIKSDKEIVSSILEIIQTLEENDIENTVVYI